ncbi:hypothetical protein [Pedobacter mendelii]|uniref:Uncharacterized protein n=1 Tax=Pedobacter mendelii TaxID=1908240 RepID=A0ABQ2BHR6_9SPHI|nr:hypothetical protein [Pedobacter mendelii]GGI26542.1 hypothetical protein GCM10008119_23170 [Pedobacter mendelii]
MEKFSKKKMMLKAGMPALALALSIWGLSNLNGAQANSQTQIRLRDVSAVSSSSQFAILDAKASEKTEIGVAETVSCSENGSECTVTYNGGTATINGKKQ